MNCKIIGNKPHGMNSNAGINGLYGLNRNFQPFQHQKRWQISAKNHRSKWPGRKRRYINWLKKDSLKPISYDMCRGCGAPIKPDHVCLQCFTGPPRKEPLLWHKTCAKQK